jgi:hypothetical protein
MKAKVPYLARLARKATGQPALQPPRRLFFSDIDLPVDSPDSPDSPGFLLHHAADVTAPSLPGSLPASGGDELPMPQAPAAASQGGPAAVEPAVAGNVAAMSAGRQPAAAIRATPGRPELPRPPRAVPLRPDGSPADLPGTTMANPAGIRPVTPPTEPRSGRDSRPEADGLMRRGADGLVRAEANGFAQPPVSWASSLSDGPVTMPDARRPTPTAGQAAELVSRAVLGPIVLAGSRRKHDPVGAPDGAAASQAGRGPGTPPAFGASELDRPREPTAVRDPILQPASDPPPAAISETGPGEPRVPRRPRVSIGTIEVTVVPPAPPAPAVPEIRIPVPVTPGRPRPPSPFAAGEGADRLRHGLRRWYGTAQG